MDAQSVRQSPDSYIDGADFPKSTSHASRFSGAGTGINPSSENLKNPESKSKTEKIDGPPL